MASKTSSRKAKGRKMQDFVRDIFRDIFRNTLESGDIESRIMGCSGTDIVLSPSANKLIPFAIETKNVEKFNINSALKQCENNAEVGRVPIVVFSKNRDSIYVALKFEDFIKLMYPEWIPEIQIKGKNVIPLINPKESDKT
jgi:hypothetical protein